MSRLVPNRALPYMGQIVALVDVVAVKVGIPGGVGDLHGVHGTQSLVHAPVFSPPTLPSGLKLQHGGDAPGERSCWG